MAITSVSSDEPDNAGGDGNTINDIVIAGDCKSVQLRKERMGSGNGRVYTITLTVTDSGGNTSYCNGDSHRAAVTKRIGCGG